MNEATMWWVLAGGLVAFELASGSFYLLVLGLGAAAAALTAMAGFGTVSQLVAAAMVGGAGVLSLAQWRKGRPATRQEAKDQHLDLGARVEVTAWDALGHAQVRHRGASWTAILAPGQTPIPGVYRIQTMAGNRLVLEKI